MTTSPPRSRSATPPKRALAHLAAAGPVLVRRNYRVARGPRVRGGGVDLVRRDRDGTIVFIEARVRASGSNGCACLRRELAKTA
jgi:putative endonuclease